MARGRFKRSHSADWRLSGHGRLVTIYDSQSSTWHRRDHMAALRYRLD